MTTGNIYSLIIRFAVPLLLGNLFQQFYNTVDSVILGNYVGKEALAAVGATSQFVHTLIGFFMGFSTGGSILISQYFGAKNIESLGKTIHTLILSTVILGVLFTVLGINFNFTLLKLNSTPDDVLASAHTYLTIHFEGILFLMLYNAGAGILRAVGNSSGPVYFLVISSLVNVILDLLFVVQFELGIAGAAYATLIAQAVSAVLVLLTLFRTNEVYRLSFNKLRIDFPILAKILALGVPGGLQMSVTSFSNIFVQTYINRFGSDCMAGWAVFNKIDQICLLPMQSLQLSSTTFAGQNYGAGNMERAEKGTSAAVIMGMIIGALLLVILQIFPGELTAVFNREEGVLYYGTYFIRVCSLFYIIRVWNPILSGSLRGFGNVKAPMLILLFGFVVWRQLYLYVTTRFTESFFPVSIAYPVGWTMCSVLMLVYYLRFTKKVKE
ncbi:MAG: MATE family efflux transporter [Treponema sp.]|nr:MATE family efflux transporter [Treponema sp.]